MTLANFAQHIFYRHFTILEIQLNSRRTFNSHFMFFRALGKSFKSSFNNKRSKLIAIYFRKHGIHICKAAIGDPAFLSVQHIMFSIFA